MNASACCLHNGLPAEGASGCCICSGNPCGFAEATRNIEAHDRRMDAQQAIDFPARRLATRILAFFEDAEREAEKLAGPWNGERVQWAGGRLLTAIRSDRPLAERYAHGKNRTIPTELSDMADRWGVPFGEDGGPET